MLSEPHGDAASGELRVWTGDVDECLLERGRLVVFEHRDGGHLRLRVAGVHHHLHLGVAHRRQHQLADLQHRQVRRPEAVSNSMEGRILFTDGRKYFI